MVKAPESKFGFTLKRTPDGRHVAVFECSRCRTTCQVAPRFPLNPEAAANDAAARHGWRADGYRASVARCPACLARKEPGESPGPKPTTNPTKESALSAHNPVSAVAPLKKATPLSLAVPPMSAERGPNPSQKQRMRALLDRHFDDSAGAYLDDYSDQRIGEEADVPWSWVQKLREAAYGPLRVDPEVVAVRNELNSLTAQLGALEKKWQTEGSALSAKIGEAFVKLDKMAASRAVAS